MELASAEALHARVVGYVRRVPRSRGVDQPARADLPPVVRDAQAVLRPRPLVANALHLHWAPHLQVDLLFVSREVARHRRPGLHLMVRRVHNLVERHAGQVVDAVHGAERQGGPALAPGAARNGAGIQHEEPAAGGEPTPFQVIGGGEPCLPRAYHQDVGHQPHTWRTLAAYITRQWRGGAGHLLPRSCGSSASRRPSPRRLKPTTARKMAKPGKVVTD